MATIRKRGNKYQAQVRRKGFDTQVRTFHLHCAKSTVIGTMTVRD